MTDFKRGYDDSWFFTPEWQAKEREADKDAKGGRYVTCSPQASILYLRRVMALEVSGLSPGAARNRAVAELQAEGHQVELGPGYLLDPA